MHSGALHVDLAVAKGKGSDSWIRSLAVVCRTWPSFIENKCLGQVGLDEHLRQFATKLIKREKCEH